MGTKLHQRIADSIETHKRMIAKLKEMDKDVKLISKLFPEERYSLWIGSEIQLSFQAQSMDEVKSMLATFAKNGAMLDRFLESDTNPNWILKTKSGNYIRISPSIRPTSSGPRDAGPDSDHTAVEFTTKE